VAVDGTLLHVELANRSAGELRVYFAAEGPSGRMHDFLTVALTGADGERLLRFTGDRNASTVGLVDLAPGDSVADDLDLHAWALEPINGATPPAPGRYALTATYRVDQPGVWSGEIVAGPVGFVVGEA
jgi:hypothetical protein